MNENKTEMAPLREQFMGIFGDRTEEDMDHVLWALDRLVGSSFLCRAEIQNGRGSFRQQNGHTQKIVPPPAKV